MSATILPFPKPFTYPEHWTSGDCYLFDWQREGYGLSIEEATEAVERNRFILERAKRKEDADRQELARLLGRAPAPPRRPRPAKGELVRRVLQRAKDKRESRRPR